MLKCRSVVFVGLLLAVTSIELQAQVKSTMSVVFTSEGYAGKVIPDPTNLLSIAPFLRNSSVAEELRMDGKQREEIETLLRNSRGSLTSIFVEATPGKILTSDEVHAQRTAFQAANAKAFHSIVDPLQCERLQQIAYQVEASRIGLGEALQNGFLGNSIGIEVAQKGGLKIISDVVEAKCAKLLIAIDMASWEETLAELSASQRRLAIEALGKGFIFRDDPKTNVYEFRTNTSAGKLNSIPDPTSSIAVAALALNESIAQELALERDKQQELTKLHQSVKGPLATAGRRLRSETIESELQKKIEVIFSPKQRERLKQIAYQVEVTRTGIAEALSSGFLGKEIGLDDKQKQTLLTKTATIEAKVVLEKLRVKNAAQEEILKQLTPTQREKANKLLGASFLFRDEAFRPFE